MIRLDIANYNMCQNVFLFSKKTKKGGKKIVEMQNVERKPVRILTRMFSTFD